MKLPFTYSTQFGVTTSSIVQDRSNGHQLVVLASIYQHSPFVLVASKESGIEHVHHLAGKRIMIEPNAADIIVYMADEGISQDKFTLIEHTFTNDPIVSGEVDAMTAYTTDEPYFLDSKDFEYAVLSPLAGGIDFYGDLLFTTEKMVEQQPEMVKEIREATIKGWYYAMNNKDELVDIIYNKYSKRHSIDHLRFEADKVAEFIMPNVVEIGYSNRGRWERISNIYKKAGLLDSGFNINGLLYNDYLKPVRVIPWQLIIVYSIVTILVGAIAFFYYFLSISLKKEVKIRKKMQARLSEKTDMLGETIAAKDNFFSIIAHDLRGPLGALSNLVEMIINKQDELDKKARTQILKEIYKGSRKAFNLLDNLLKWALSEQGKIKAKPKELFVCSVVDHNVAVLKEEIELKHNSIEVDICPGAKIFADENMINTVIRNLISNANKFTPENGKIRVYSDCKPENKFITLFIRDNGVGIEQKVLKNLFNLDSNFTTKGTNNESGTGLGLKLCAQFIRKNNGSIKIESVVDQGTTIVLKIPVPST